MRIVKHEKELIGNWFANSNERALVIIELIILLYESYFSFTSPPFQDDYNLFQFSVNIIFNVQSNYQQERSCYIGEDDAYEPHDQNDIVLIAHFLYF